MPWYKKVLGIAMNGSGAEREILGETTPNGYTVLDTDKIAKTPRFERLSEQVDDFPLDTRLSSNGHGDGAAPSKKK